MRISDWSSDVCSSDLVLEALRLLGLDETAAAAAGISLYKIGCIWPLEPEGARAFVDGHEMLLVIEEKKSFIEAQLAELLFNIAGRPLLTGRSEEHTSELQSLMRSSYAVFCLKKKTNIDTTTS